MKSIFSARLLAGCVVLFSALQAQAAYVWLDKDASGTAKASLGELNGKKEGVTGLGATRAFLADGRDLGLTIAGETVSIATPVSGRDLRFTARVAGEKNAIQYYHARYGRNETKAANDLELVPTDANGNTFKLFWKGSAVAATQVNVVTADGWSRVLRPEADGSVKLPTSVPGLYVLEVSVKVNGTVTVDGKPYDDVRHTATLSFTVDEKCK
jgi:hypothetical protein